MQKTLIATAITLSLGSSATAQAATITVTHLNFGGDAFNYTITGTLNDAGTGGFQSDPFLFYSITATQQNWFDTHSSTLTWSGTGSLTNPSDAYTTFSYTFHLTGNQVAVGMYWDWNSNNNIPVLAIFDCSTGGAPNTCSGETLPLAAVFTGEVFSFSGTTTTDFAVSGGVVPLPAAAWLMGSGLLGLVGLARRRKVSTRYMT